MGNERVCAHIQSLKGRSQYYDDENRMAMRRPDKLKDRAFRPLQERFPPKEAEQPRFQTADEPVEIYHCAEESTFQRPRSLDKTAQSPLCGSMEIAKAQWIAIPKL